MRWLLAAGVVGLVSLPLAFAATNHSAAGRPDPSALAHEIPPPFLDAYLDAADAWDIDWALLAAIGKLECDHGRYQAPGCWPPGSINHAGARGPMQFLGSTWRATATIHQPDVAGPPTADGHGYATDGDGDGIADPWSTADAVHAAARYLVDLGGRADPHRGARSYNAGPNNADRTAGTDYARRALELVSYYHTLARHNALASSPPPLPAGAGHGCTEPDPTGTGGCVTPATAHLVHQLRRSFGDQLPLACHGHRPNNPNSDHPHGRACDITIGTIGRHPDTTDHSHGWKITNWLTTHATELAIRYIIWDGQQWTGTNWTTYTGGGAYNPRDATGGHYDHIHISTDR